MLNQTVNTSQDQTQFMENVSEIEHTYSATEQFREAEKKKKIKIIAGIIGFVVFFSMILVITLSSRSQTPQAPQLPEETPEPVVEELTPFQQQIKDLQQSVQEADPQINDYPFPPISFELFIIPE